MLIHGPGLAGVVLEGDLAAFLQERLDVDPLAVGGHSFQDAGGDHGGNRLAVPGEDLRDRVAVIGRGLHDVAEPWPGLAHRPYRAPAGIGHL